MIGGIGLPELCGQFWNFFADAFHDAAGKLVGAVVAVVGVVFQGFSLSGERSGGEVDESFLGLVGSKGLIKLKTHGMEVEDGDVLFLAELTNCGGEVGEGFLGFAILPAKDAFFSGFPKGTSRACSV